MAEQNITRNNPKKSAKRRRAYHLAPKVRAEIPSLFDCMNPDWIAETHGIPVQDVVIEALRDVRAQLRRMPVQSERRADLPMVRRAGA